MFSLIVFGGTVVLLLLAVAVAAYVVLIFNRLVRLKHEALKAWSNIDVLIRQRHDEIPKLVESCKRYMTHERATLVAVLHARRAVAEASDARDMTRLGAAEAQLRQGLSSVFAAVEAYPVLQADESFRRLETRIVDLENAIADRREFFNDCVNSNNIRLEQFPDVIIARVFGFEPLELLSFDADDLADVDLRQLFA
ncbi:LemA family protein [Methylolobus aquaticus]|uniref:LemA family protein n=1 Tax=Methylotetracoccus oryzae TaxID=1919059 RepID=UPI00101F7671|nr:LemA family protein [Methylotetracoccus oryzae]RYU61902.1 LemA family protein [Methylolobus aquaticus]